MVRGRSFGNVCVFRYLFLKMHDDTFDVHLQNCEAFAASHRQQPQELLNRTAVSNCNVLLFPFIETERGIGYTYIYMCVCSIL